MNNHLHTVKSGDTITWISGAVRMPVRVTKVTKTQITIIDGVRFSIRTGQQIGFANHPYAPRVAA